MEQVEKILIESDKKVHDILKKEQQRQKDSVELIASENFVSPAVMAAYATEFTNKYAEGYPGKRYYGGCEFVDELETLAIDRLKEIFNANYANVQPHSGSQANMAAYFSILNPHDRILGMDLSQGGHLTHGSPVNFSGKLFDIESYGVDSETGRIDYDVVLDKAKRFKPHMILAGASAYSRQIDFSKFREIADAVGAYLLVDMAHIAGLVATGLHPDPIPYADIVTSTTHKTLRGARGGIILSSNEDIAKKINSSIFPGNQGGPLEQIIAGKAVGFKEALRPEFKQYQQQVINNAKALVSELQKLGYKIISGGTDNHLLLIDVHSQGLTGKVVQELLDTVMITTNKNTIPNETLSPFVTSGIRLGTPAMTTRGMKENDMKTIVEFIQLAIVNKDNEQKLKDIKANVVEFTNKFPMFAYGY